MTTASNDLIIARALKFHPLEVIEAMRPWCGYVAILMWKSYAGVLKKDPKSSISRIKN